MKFSYTKDTESDLFIRNPNLTKNIWRLGEEGLGYRLG